MKVVLCICLLMLTACAGVTEYEITTPDGVSVIARNTKDYDTYELSAKKNPDGSYSVKLKETGISASNPLKAAQEANSKLLDKILSIAPGVNTNGQ